MTQTTISGINNLSHREKRDIFTKLIPPQLLNHFQLNSSLIDSNGNDLLSLRSYPGTSTAEMKLHHLIGFQDPILYGHITDTLNGQVHVLLYMLQDPNSPRFDVDKLMDGTPTRFGTQYRNIEAELCAMKYGLAPGQIRSGLRLLSEAIQSFEEFVKSLDHELYFVEPLYYHNAVIFERYGFAYQKGKALMKNIQTGFSPGGELLNRLDDSSPFRQSEAVNSIRLRSWAIHDNILGYPFSDVTMYKSIEKTSFINTSADCPW